MRMTTRICLGPLAASGLFLLGGMAAAQDGDLLAQVEDFQQRYEAAVAAGDWETMGALFTENATFLPMTGGMIEGRDGVRSYYEQSGQTELDVRSSKTEALGETMLIDIGTFTTTLPPEAGGMEVEGEYVAVAESGENGLQIRSLTTMPVRQMPGGAAQE